MYITMRGITRYLICILNRGISHEILRYKKRMKICPRKLVIRNIIHILCIFKLWSPFSEITILLEQLPLVFRNFTSTMCVFQFQILLVRKIYFILFWYRPCIWICWRIFNLFSLKFNAFRYLKEKLLSERLNYFLISINLIYLSSSQQMLDYYFLLEAYIL